MTTLGVKEKWWKDGSPFIKTKKTSLGWSKRLMSEQPRDKRTVLAGQNQKWSSLDQPTLAELNPLKISAAAVWNSFPATPHPHVDRKSTLALAR